MILALIVVLAVSALLDLALGAWASVSWESFRQTWFLPPAGAAGHEHQLLGLVLGLILIFFAALQLDAIRGIRKEREGAYRIPILFGGYLVVSSIVTFLAIQGWSPKVTPRGGLEFLLMDGLRGGFLVALGILALHAPPTVRRLRLPKQVAVRAQHTTELSRDRDPWRKRGREGGGRNRSDRSGSRRGQGGRSAKSSQQQRPSAPAEPARTSGAEVGTKDRSLSVVVKGDYRSSTDREPGSTDSAGNEPMGRDGRRRRRRKGTSGRRSERGSDSQESSTGTGMEHAHARADEARAMDGSATAQSNGRATVQGALEAPAKRAGAASSAVDPRDALDMVGAFEGESRPAKSNGSDFGRNRRPRGSRKR
jgi:hypothetical protein